MGRSFDELVNEAEQAPIGSWNLGWLRDRATEERPSWRYFDRVAERAATATRMVDLQTGVGQMIADLPRLPELYVASPFSRRMTLFDHHSSHGDAEAMLHFEWPNESPSRSSRNGVAFSAGVRAAEAEATGGRRLHRILTTGTSSLLADQSIASNATR